MKTTLTNYDINILLKMFAEDDNILNSKDKFISAKFLWTLESNVKKIREVGQNITTARSKIDNRYSSDEFSYLDEQGVRKVKEEYLSQYKSEVNELLSIETEFDFKPIYIEDIEDKELSGDDFQSIKVMLMSREDEME